MNAIKTIQVVAAIYPTLQKIPATCAAIKASRAERKFYEEITAQMSAPTKTEPIRVKCERLA